MPQSTKENLHECGEENGLDIDAIVTKVSELEEDERQEIRPEDIGLTNSEAKQLSDCVDRLNDLDAQEEAFNAVIGTQSTIEEERLDFNQRVEKKLRFNSGDYDHCRANENTNQTPPIDRHYVETFRQCAHEHLSTKEKIAKYLLIGLMALTVIGTAGGVGYSIYSDSRYRKNNP